MLDRLGGVVGVFAVEPLMPLALRGSPKPLRCAPDVPGVLHGWYVWRVREDADGPLLVSQSGGDWRDGWAHPGCAALRDSPGLRRLLPRLPLADDRLCVGRVLLWGRVVEHERGYRAEAAYPADAVAPDPETAAALERRYGVPVASATELDHYARLM